MIWYRLAHLPVSRGLAPAWVEDWAVGAALVPLDGTREAPDVARARAWVSSLNPLADAPPMSRPEGSVVLRTGCSVGDRPAWMPGGREALEKFLAAMPGDAEVWLWPAVDHVLSDVPSITGFLRRHAEGVGTPGPRVRLLFDPASMLAPSMLARAEDHLSRVFEALAAHPATAAVLLANLSPGSDVEGARLVAWHAGAIGPRLLADLVRAHVSRDAEIVLIDDRLGEQVEAMRGRGI